MGLAVCGLYLPYNFALYALFTIVCIFMVYFIVFTQWPWTLAAQLLPMLYALFGILLVLTSNFRFMSMTGLYAVIYFFSGRMFSSVPGHLGRGTR